MLSDPRPVVICYYFHYLPGNWVWLQFLCAVKIWGDLPRYITLSYCIALRTVSFRLKKRFPTIDHLVHAGVMRQVFNIIFKLHCFFDENQDCCYYLEISKLQMSVFKLEHFNQQEIIILIIVNIAKGTTDPRHWVFRGRVPLPNLMMFWKNSKGPLTRQHCRISICEYWLSWTNTE